MILYLLAILFISLLGIILSPFNFLAAAALPAGVSSSLGNIGAIIAVFGYVLDLGVLVFLVFSTIGVELAIFSYKGIKWIYNKIPGIS